MVLGFAVGTVVLKAMTLRKSLSTKTRNIKKEILVKFVYL